MKLRNTFAKCFMVALAGILVIAASSAPAFAKKYKWQPSSWTPSGITWDSILEVSKYVTEKSEGKLTLKPSAPGAIVPVPEQLEAVSMGTMQACFIWPGYFPGQLPVAFTHGDCMAAPKNISEMRELYEEYEDGKIMKILREEYKKHGVYLVGNVYWVLDNLMISRKPINGVKDIKGLKFRTSELIAHQLAKLGAGTVWVPGNEIYTLLSTGGVDAITYSNAHDMVAMGFHEVTKYWVKNPTAVGPAADALIVNLDTWNSLPDEYKKLLEEACKMASDRNEKEAKDKIAKAWDFAKGKGIEIIEWSDEDIKTLANLAREVVPEKYFKNKAFTEIFKITEKWAIEKGYWTAK